MEQYDVAIIGAGVTGAATAAVLSRYQLRTVVLEKAADVSFGVSKANSGIIHGGFHYPLTTLKGRLEILGNMMFEKLQYELGFPFRRCGIVVAAFSTEELETVRKLYRRGLENRVPRIELCDGKRMLELEPKLAGEVMGRRGHQPPHKRIPAALRGKLRRLYRCLGIAADGDVRAVVDDDVVNRAAARKRNRRRGKRGDDGRVERAARGTHLRTPA